MPITGHFLYRKQHWHSLYETETTSNITSQNKNAGWLLYQKFHYVSHNLFIFRYINHNLFIYLLRTPCTQTSQDGSYQQEICLTLAPNIAEHLRSTASVCFMYVPIPHYHLVKKAMGALTHWGRDKMAGIFQMTFLYAFSWMKIYEYQLKFHWSLFPWVQLTIFQHWFR